MLASPCRGIACHLEFCVINLPQTDTWWRQGRRKGCCAPGRTLRNAHDFWVERFIEILPGSDYQRGHGSIFVPYSFKRSLLQAIFYVLILHFLPIHFPKYTHILSLLSTSPWDREYIGTMLLAWHQRRIAKEIARSSRKQNKMRQNNH